MENGFKKREVERSFQKFRDNVTYVFNSDIYTFTTFFNNLIFFCETDEVMRVITSQLKQIDISYDDWFNQLPQPYGRPELDLPTNETERTALIYKICIKIQKKEIDRFNFCLTLNNSLSPNGTISFFNLNLLTPFIDSVGYKIDDITCMINEDYQGTAIIPFAVFNVFVDNSVTLGNNNKFKSETAIGRGANIEKE